jgi:hypothetical protein
VLYSSCCWAYLSELFILGVLDFYVVVAAHSACGAVCIPLPVRFCKRVALSKGDPVSCSAESREYVFVHVSAFGF